MRVQPIQPIPRTHNRKPKTVDIDTYRRIKAEVEEHQPDAEEWFDRVDQMMEKAWPWIIVLSIIYLAVQLSRALINGWLP